MRAGNAASVSHFARSFKAAQRGRGTLTGMRCAPLLLALLACAPESMPPVPASGPLPSLPPPAMSAAIASGASDAAAPAPLAVAPPDADASQPPIAIGPAKITGRKRPSPPMMGPADLDPALRKKLCTCSHLSVGDTWPHRFPGQDLPGGVSEEIVSVNPARCEVVVRQANVRIGDLSSVDAPYVRSCADFQDPPGSELF
jgi:hypothetical protein